MPYECMCTNWGCNCVQSDRGQTWDDCQKQCGRGTPGAAQIPFPVPSQQQPSVVIPLILTIGGILLLIHVLRGVK